MRKKEIVSVVFLVGLTFSVAFASYFPLTEENQKIYRALETIANLAQENSRWQELKSGNPTRLDLAIFYNYCVNKLSQQQKILPEEETDLLYQEFNSELLLLDIKNRLDKQETAISGVSLISYNIGLSFLAEQMSGDIPVSADTTIYGNPPKEPAISLRQQLRLGMKIGQKTSFARLLLRNFGFWGVGSYSSGSMGINFATSDAPSVEEVYFQTSNQHLFWTVGRRYWRLDRFGLVGDFSYQPLEFTALRVFSGIFAGEILAGSKIDAPDYYGMRLGLETEKLSFGICGYTTAFRPATLSDYNLSNDCGWAGDFALTFYQKNQFSAEYYQYINSDEKLSSAIGQMDLWRDQNLRLTVQYAQLANINLDSIFLNQMPLEYRAWEFLRYEANTSGPEIFLWFRILPELSGEYEFAYRQKNLLGGDDEVEIQRANVFRIVYDFAPEKESNDFSGREFLTRNKFHSGLILEGRIHNNNDELYRIVRLLVSLSF